MAEIDRFIYCPNCGSDEINETDYEDEDGEEDTDGRECDKCGWQGDVAELVCQDSGEDDDDD